MKGLSNIKKHRQFRLSTGYALRVAHPPLIDSDVHTLFCVIYDYKKCLERIEVYRGRLSLRKSSERSFVYRREKSSC